MLIVLFCKIMNDNIACGECLKKDFRKIIEKHETFN